MILSIMCMPIRETAANSNFLLTKKWIQTINFVGSSADSSISTAFSYTLPAPETTTLSDGSVVYLYSRSGSGLWG